MDPLATHQDRLPARFRPRSAQQALQRGHAAPQAPRSKQASPRVRCLGLGSALPGQHLPGALLDNETLARLSREASERMTAAGGPDVWPPCDPGFPEARIGVLTRGVLDRTQTVADLALAAAQEGLRQLGVRPGEGLCRRLRLVLVATVSSAAPVPAVATQVAGWLGAPEEVQAFDLVLGCNGFVSALDVARRWLDAQAPGDVALVIGAEAMSRVLHAADRASAPIFGDGAGAMFLERVAGGAPPDAVDAYTLAAGGPRIRIANFPLEQGPVLRTVVHAGQFSIESDRVGRLAVCMEGRTVFRDMVRRLPEAIERALQLRGLGLDDIDHFVFHQANRRLIEAIAGAAGLPAERVPTNIEHVGNTTSASIPLLLHELQREGRLCQGQRVLLVGFGTGYSLGVTTLLAP